MLLVMGVSLYTSRVVLEILGIDDFGIYQTVGGIVGMLAFINSALSTGISRFLTYGLGQNDPEKLKRTFSTSVTIQLILCLLILIGAETVGLWFVYHKLEIPNGSITATVWAYQTSIIATVFSMVSVPYMASIISHEKMSVFAYIGIFEVFAKLGIVYLLTIGNINKLILYSILMMGIHFMILSLAWLYCKKNFSETNYCFLLDKPILKEIAGFSGWSLFAASSIALNNQGVLVLLNMFFSPAVVTARAISLQVNNAANQFVNNFRTAVNPQIIKLYAAGDFASSKSLLLNSTKFSFYLMFILSLPICMAARPLLKFWLKDVPDYTVIFLQLVVIQSLFQVFDTSFYTALYAKGDLKANALISPTIGFIVFPIVYILFKLGFSPVSLSWATLIMYAILGTIVKPILIIKIVNYTWKDIFSVYIPCAKVCLVAIPLTVIAIQYIHLGNFMMLLVTTLISTTICSFSIYMFGLDNVMRTRVNNVIKDMMNNIFIGKKI